MALTHQQFRREEKTLLSFAIRRNQLNQKKSVSGLTNESIHWYSEPLDADDLFAGLFLIVFALIFVPLYALVAYVMFRDDKEIIGFRYLFSAAIADILLLINYGIVPGISILFKSQLIAPNARHWLQIYLDWAWFSMCYHYSLISWSRFAAIRSPHSFRIQSRCLSYTLCAGCYVLALIQVLCTHFRSWYVTFYYEPSAYGMLSENFNKYLEDGQSSFFMSFHVIMMVIPLFFYTWSIWLLTKHRNGITTNRRRSSFSSVITKSKSRVEMRLILPCVFNAVVFTIGQVLMTIGTGEGKWATWSVMVLFSTNSAVNPVLLIIFSAVIRLIFINFCPSRHISSRLNVHELIYDQSI
ncbi:unnamed protein product [Anisakis simplex]|uniref:G protein-coupled receptor n=1 Tax=Anisakis simplex TaxID=6269 RepID=A0A0M3K0T0_ANISI|nr:unnamed protein product [Anisakis simplex]